MNELAKSFEARGLTLVGVTSEGKQPTEEWVQEHEVSYPYAYDEKGKLSRYFGVKGIPHAVLLDPSGTVVWSGHPAGLDAATIESALAGAVTTPLWTWPEEATVAKQYLLKRDYAEALASAQQLEGPYAEIVQGLITARVTEIRAAIEEGDYLRAAGAAERASRDLDGLPEGDEARTRLRELQDDPQAKRVMKGQRELARLQAEVATVRLVVDAQRLLTQLEALRDEYPGTIVASRAEAEFQSLQARLPQGPPPR